MRGVSILIVMLLLVAGCARPKATALPAPDVTLAGTAWTVERIDDVAADRAAATVRFEDGRASGRSGCNQYSGYLQASGSALRVSEVRSTRMACATGRDGAGDAIPGRARRCPRAPAGRAIAWCCSTRAAARGSA